MSVGNTTLLAHHFYVLTYCRRWKLETTFLSFSLQGSQLDSTTEKLSYEFYKVEDKKQHYYYIKSTGFKDVKFCSRLLLLPGKYQSDVAGSYDHLQLFPAVLAGKTEN